MTRLMISVRDSHEAAIALDGGAEMIDVKEPARGALGAADVQTIAEIVETVQRQRPLSVALGELHEGLIDIRAVEGIDFAKIGLAQMRSVPDWFEQWSAVVRSLPHATTAVAVVYVDVDHSPPFPAVLAAAKELSCGAVLLDTFVKDGRSLFDWMGDRRLKEIARSVKQADLDLVLAGALQADLVRRAAEFQPLAIAVRSAACCQQRQAAIDGHRVAELYDRLHSNQIRQALR